MTPDQVVGSNPAGVIFFAFERADIGRFQCAGRCKQSIIGLVVEYIVAIDVTRVRFPDDAFWVILSFVIL